MRKRLILLAMTAISTLAAVAQGVTFVDKQLDEALALAKKQGKMVFVDCYGTYCPPCKKMLVEEFPKKEMGDYLNKGFVSVKYNLDKEPYKVLAKRWEVSMYPTFVFLNSDGELLYRMVGFREADKFIAEAKQGIADNTIGKLEKQYEGGDRSYGFLMTYLKELERMKKRTAASKIAHEMLSLPTTDITTDKEAFGVFCSYIDNPYDELFLKAHKQVETLVAAYGEQAREKIDRVWMDYAGHFGLVENGEFKGYDWDKVKEYVAFMRQHGAKNPEKVEKTLRDSWKQYQEFMEKQKQEKP